MGKRAYRGKRKGGSNSTRNVGFKYWRHPLAEADPAAIRAVVLSIASKSTEDFPLLVQELLDLLRKKEPLHVLGVLSGYGSFATVKDDGVASHGMIEHLLQHHVELLQALILTLQPGDWGQELAAPADIQIAIDLIIKVADAFHLRRLASFQKETGIEQRTNLGLQERIRMHTQAVRNWGYYEHVIQISTELYAPLNDQFVKRYGFSGTDLIKVARCLVSISQRRVSAKFVLLKKVFRERKISRLIRKYYELFPQVQGEPEDFLKNMPPDITLQVVKSLVLSHSDISFADLFMLSHDEISSESGVTSDETAKILDNLSLKPGGLVDRNPEYLFLDNPIWVAPIIQLEDEFFCALPQCLFSHINQIMRSLCDLGNFKSSHERRRASYLEDKVSTVLRKAFPSAKIIDGGKWSSAGIQYETDHIVKLDRTVFVVEDKSGALSGPALRGAPDRVKHHVNELIVGSSVQSARLEEIILKASSGDINALSDLSNIELDFSDVSKVVRVSVTLEDFSVFASAVGELRDAGWIPADIELATTLSIADFQCVTEILNKQSFLAHYFIERQRFQKKVIVLADELDWLGYYLETGLNSWNLEKDHHRLMLTGMSRNVDRYYTGLDAGLVCQKPRPKVTPFFETLITGIESRAFPGWLDISIDILRLADYREQVRLDRMLVECRANVEKNWRVPEHKCSIVVTPPPNRDAAAVFYVFPKRLASRRMDIAHELGEKALEISKCQRCIVVGKCIEEWEEPYSFIVVLYAT